jgi:hypothetical protein
MTYLIAYFVINFIIVGKIIHNVYFVSHDSEYKKELKGEVSFYIPLTILFGTIFITMEYYYRFIDGE